MDTCAPRLGSRWARLAHAGVAGNRALCAFLLCKSCFIRDIDLLRCRVAALLAVRVWKAAGSPRLHRPREPLPARLALPPHRVASVRLLRDCSLDEAADVRQAGVGSVRTRRTPTGSAAGQSPGKRCTRTRAAPSRPLQKNGGHESSLCSVVRTGKYPSQEPLAAGGRGSSGVPGKTFRAPHLEFLNLPVTWHGP
jgi:hypothetical protein